jgi:hypothetical protein
VLPQSTPTGHIGGLGPAPASHRWDKPGTPREHEVGYRQVAELLGVCEESTPPCDVWLVCGAFNLTLQEDCVKAMRQARLAFSHDHCPATRSCLANGRARLIDYLFHSPALWSMPLDPPLLGDDHPTACPGAGFRPSGLPAEVGCK